MHTLNLYNWVLLFFCICDIGAGLALIVLHIFDFFRSPAVIFDNPVLQKNVRENFRDTFRGLFRPLQPTQAHPSTPGTGKIIVIRYYPCTFTTFDRMILYC